MGYHGKDASMLVLRKLKSEHYDRMIECWTKSNLQIKIKGRESRESIEREMSLSTTIFLGAFDKKKGDKLVGLAIGNYDGRRGWVNRLAVLPEYRRLKMASILITRIEAFLRSRGAKVISALIDRSNMVSRRLFESQGYSNNESILYYSKRESSDA